MTIPESVQLVLQAAVLGRGGEVFVHDMGEPIKIVDLASDLIRLSGLRVGDDVEIQFTGLRPGEKLFEELSRDDESLQPTAHRTLLSSRLGIPPAGVHAHVDAWCSRRCVATTMPCCGSASRSWCRSTSRLAPRIRWPANSRWSPERRLPHDADERRVVGHR